MFTIFILYPKKGNDVLPNKKGPPNKNGGL
jgi:hypothetical protein